MTHSGYGVVLHWFLNPAAVLAPVGFEFINPAKSGSGRIWKIGIRYIVILYPSICDAVHCGSQDWYSGFKVALSSS